MCSTWAQPPFIASQFGVGTSGPGDQWFYGANTGSSIHNMVGRPFAVNGLDEETYSAGQFASTRMCRQGAKNVDMSCVCPFTQDSAPWQQQSPELVARNFNLATATYAGPANIPDCAGRWLTQVHGMYGPDYGASRQQWTHY